MSKNVPFLRQLPYMLEDPPALAAGEVDSAGNTGPSYDFETSPITSPSIFAALNTLHVKSPYSCKTKNVMLYTTFFY